jgi:hypothetical protein
MCDLGLPSSFMEAVTAVTAQELSHSTPYATVNVVPIRTFYAVQRKITCAPLLNDKETIQSGPKAS